MSPATVEDTSAPPNMVGNLADLKAGEILLPDFVARRQDGLYADPTSLSDGGFMRFVERVFAAGGYFQNLDYSVFARLLTGRPDSKAMRFAESILPFPLPRRSLYKAVKLAAGGGRAEYLFEPVYLADADGEDEDGQGEPARLSFDEFVAHLWVNSIRFGLDEKAVRHAIEAARAERVEVARELAPTAGTDATLAEVSKALHRDNSPRILANGQIDLSQFRNRYPQVKEGEVLLRKVPRQLGEPGRRLSGETIEPNMPADFELAELAGAGTRIEQQEDGACIVAAMTGFLDLDPASNKVAVTEKIVSREGVSMRTTGNLSLTGDDFEEFGEVQERRVVEGKNMTFHANVYGNLLSRGGKIHLLANLSGGKASSPHGEVVVDGRATASVLEAAHGKVQIKYAEGCAIVASEVYVEHAVMCQVLGEAVEIGKAESCAVAARSLSIAQCGTHKDVESVLSALVPDFSAHDEAMRKLAQLRLDKQAELEACKAEQAALRQQPEFARFLALQMKIQKGEIKVAPAQAESLHKAAARFAPSIQQLQSLTASLHALRDAITELTRQHQAMELEKVDMAKGIRCLIENMTGETLVRTRVFNPKRDLFDQAGLDALLAQLRAFGDKGERLFAGSQGRFGWQFGTDADFEGGWVE